MKSESFESIREFKKEHIPETESEKDNALINLVVEIIVDSILEELYEQNEFLSD